jgi:hypothetical protein
MRLENLLTGAIDVHIHAAPSIVKRKLDAVEVTKEAQDAGMRAIVLKDHQTPTVGEAKIVQKYHVTKQPFDVFAGVVLNNHVGGLNPKALETAILLGARVVWLPTVSCENHHRYLASGGVFVHTDEKLPETPISLIDAEGNLTNEVITIMEIIKEHPEVAIVTGHASSDEINVFMKQAKKMGLKRVMANHPNFLVGASIEEMISWSEAGAFIELCAVTSDPISSQFHCPAERLIEIIKRVGAQHIIISSDYGQIGNPNPVAGFLHFFEYLLELGVTEEELELMVKKNPAYLLGIED